jgi:hypothetical protein
MKICGKCNQELEISFFHRNKSTKDGLQAWCRACMKAEHDRHLDFYKEYQKSYVGNRKENQTRRRETKRESVLYEQARHRASAKNIPFDIELSDIVIPDFCPILGVPISLETGKGRTGNSPSIDRIRPELGYTKGNIAIISDRANTVKSFGTADQHRRIADWMDAQQINWNQDVGKTTEVGGAVWTNVGTA